MARIRPAALLLTLALALAAGVQAQAPSAFETEVWRGAHSIGTVAAYQAYLQRFPDGAYAALARAAIDKLGGGTAAAPLQPPAPPPPSTVGHLRGEIDTGVASVALGDRFVGPGVITAGGLGSQRQVVLPAGEWVTLAGFDRRSADLQPITVSTLVFGQFGGAQLRSLLVVSLNRRSISVPAGNHGTLLSQGLLPAWPEAQACEQVVPVLYREVSGTRHLKLCRNLRALAGEDALGAWPGLGASLERALADMRAVAPGFNLRSELHITDQRYNHLSYTRLDCAGADAGGRCGTLDTRLTQPRVAWLQAFVPVAQAAFGREIESEDLKPGSGPRRAAPFTLPD